MANTPDLSSLTPKSATVSKCTLHKVGLTTGLHRTLQGAVGQLYQQMKDGASRSDDPAGEAREAVNGSTIVYCTRCKRYYS